jgi:hypothetical protein
MAPRLKRTAYHEAGHAVAAYLLNRDFKSVTIIREGDTLGQCSLTKLDDFHPDINSDHGTLAHLEEYMIMLHAGLASEYLATGRYNRAGAYSDLTIAAHLAANACGTDEEVQLYRELMMVRAKNLLRLAHNWSAVQTLAEELLRRPCLIYLEAEGIIQTGMEKEPTCARCGSLAVFVEPGNSLVCFDHARPRAQKVSAKRGSPE